MRRREVRSFFRSSGLQTRRFLECCDASACPAEAKAEPASPKRRAEPEREGGSYRMTEECFDF